MFLIHTIVSFWVGNNIKPCFDQIPDSMELNSSDFTKSLISWMSSFQPFHNLLSQPLPDEELLQPKLYKMSSMRWWNLLFQYECSEHLVCWSTQMHLLVFDNHALQSGHSFILDSVVLTSCWLRIYISWHFCAFPLFRQILLWQSTQSSLLSCWALKDVAHVFRLLYF